MSMDAVPIRWSKPALVAFRFVFVYLLLYNFAVFWFLPKGEWLAEKYQWPWDQLGVWVGDTVFGVDAHRPEGTGSGDTWADYVLMFNYVVIATIATVIWSIVDRRRVAYPRLLDGLRSGVRLVFGMTLVVYGLSKVFYTQFGPLEGPDLIRTYGDSSPMGLLWRFMGHSYAYCAFTGGVECLGGVLLLWRRTALLGALISTAAMLQVFILNMCFDVCVKLYSFHLLLMAVWLVLPDVGRLVDFFLFHRAVEARPLRTPYASPRLERARRPVKLVILAVMFYKVVDGEIDQYNQYGLGKTAHPMEQIYQVDRHVVAGVEKPPLTTDATRWKRVIIGGYGWTSITFMDDHKLSFEHQLDEKAQTITLTSPDKTASPDYVLHYTRTDATHYELTTDVDGKPNVVSVTMLPRESFLIVNRGFHWHQEYPFNR